jgi:hypothetical protein
MRRVILLSLLISLSAAAAEIRSVEVDSIDGRYTMHSEVWLDADVEAVYSVFLDYDLSVQFSSAIVESRNIEPDESGRRRFYIRNRGCVLKFCASFERYGFVEHDPHRIIRATIDPETSDFHVSNETWAFRREGAGTVVNYAIEFEPKFWVPPVVGPYILKRKLESHGGGVVDPPELLARELQQ